MNKSLVLRLSSSLLLLLQLFACTISNFPTGTFTNLTGSYRLILQGDGQSIFMENDNIEAEGTYTFHADELTWETDSYCDPRGFGKATYTWSFENDKLIFKVKGEDPCLDRYSALHLMPYQLEK